MPVAWLVHPHPSTGANYSDAHEGHGRRPDAKVSLMRFAYADPPYIGCASLYPEKEEVDHERLLLEQVSPGPYVELFARHHRMLWDVWGNESANTASLEVPA